MNNKNPIFTENVNVSKTHPLVDFLWLGGASILLVVSLTIILYLSMQWLAPYIPFSFEQKLVSSFDESALSNNNPDMDSNEYRRLEYLHNLATELANAQGLQDEMTIKVHWLDDDMVNAFATLGGHIFITKGLWNEMPNENALAMVMAHEIAHIKHRDPLRVLGAGVALSLITTLIFGTSDAGISLAGSGGILTSLHFNRSMESEADKEALKTLQAYYGHVAGSTDFFERILDEDSISIPFLQTHPLTQDRINKIIDMQTENNWIETPELVKPLAEFR